MTQFDCNNSNKRYFEPVGKFVQNLNFLMIEQCEVIFVPVQENILVLNC